MKLSDKFTVFDTETNSPDPREARVLQIGLAIFKAGELKASGSRLVNPGVQWDRGRFVVQGFDGVGIEIPKDAFAVHGLGIDDVEKMPLFEQVWPKVKLTPPTVGYNTIGFDLPLLVRECRLAGLPTDVLYAPHVDLMPFVAWHFRHLKSRKLGNVCARFGIFPPDDGALHAAHTDCEVTGRLAIELVRRGIIPDDVEEAIARRRVLKAAVDEEWNKYMYWFYEDRVDGRLRMGCGKHTGKLIADVPKKAWVDLLKQAQDAREDIREMFKEFAK